MKYSKRVLIGVDQLVNSLLGGMPDETISAKVYRKSLDKGGAWKTAEKAINAMFQDKTHCYTAYQSEREQNQNHWSYTNVK